MLFTVVTIFPEVFPGALAYGLSGKNLGKLWDVNTINIRDFAKDKHLSVDDTPYGGGAGMVMRADILHEALLHALSLYNKKPYVFFMSPRGVPLSQKVVKTIMENPHTPEGAIILCGRYEGIDERLIRYWREKYGMLEISTGDYILFGGEIPALVFMDACIRLLPGVMNNKESIENESFSVDLLEYPHYTKPIVWMEESVPSVLLSGDHKKISEWREEEAKRITQSSRSDLWNRYCYVNREKV
ncbi:MAG: tRNA (guanosine(37)-N1)-methyltransferase TrmD [Holosporales bacterium]|jgi:tRNA (guanine37-N1)-methyltransferase|nr:tRNA (guanosine(37)-N1)-methyltransferase TrmD [Holosporales bacterium]